MMHHQFAIWMLSAWLYVFAFKTGIFGGFDVNRFAESDWYVYIPWNGEVIRFAYLAVCILVPLGIAEGVRYMKKWLRSISGK